MKIGISPVYGRLLAYSIIPLLLVIAGTYGGIFLLSPTLSVDLTNEYDTDFIEHHLEISEQQATNMNYTFSAWNNLLNRLGNDVIKTYDDEDLSGRQSYFHDITKDKLTPRPEFSDKYNLTIDFSTSSYHVASKTQFGNYSTQLNNTITRTSYLDFTFLSLYPSLDNLMWMNVYYNNSGLERTYPFYGPYKSTYHPLNSTINLELLNSTSNEFYISDPFLDPITGLPVFIIGKSIELGDGSKVLVKFTILLDEIIKELQHVTSLDQRTFLINDQYEIVGHSALSRSSILNSSGNLVSITSIESNETDFIELISNVENTLISYDIIEYSIDERSRIISIIQIQGLIFGLIEFMPNEVIFGTLNLIEFILIPVAVIIFFLSVMGILLRRYGFLRNVGIDTLVKLEQSVTSKIEKISKLDEESIDELIVDTIEDQGEKLRTETEIKVEEIKDQILNVDKTIAAKINEQLNSFEAKLTDAIDNKLDSIDSLIQFSKGKMNLSSDQLSSLLKDPTTYIKEIGNIFNIENLGSLEEIAKLPNDVNRAAAILLNIEDIPLVKFAELTKKDPEELKKIIQVIPSDYGIALDEDIVKLDNSKIINNFTHITQILYQINPDQEMVKKVEDQISSMDQTNLGQEDENSSNNQD